MKKHLNTLCLLFLLFSASVAWSQPVQVTLTTTPACDHDGTVTAHVVGGNPPFVYTWYIGGQQTITTDSTLTGVAGGSIFVIVADSGAMPGQGGRGYGQGFLAYPFNVSTTSTPDTCNRGVGTATITATGGTPPFTYLWSNGQSGQTATGLSAGPYDATITDGAGCRLFLSDLDTAGVNIFSWSPIVVTITRTPSTCNNGTATANPVGGTPPYSYFWNTVPVQTTQTATGLPVGSVLVTVTDAAGCTTTQWQWIAQGQSPITVTINTTPEYCNNANGTATVSAVGGVPPYTYLWSTGATTQSINGLTYGYYSVTVRDQNNCPSPGFKVVGRTTPVSVSLSASNPTCGNQDGSVTANPSGGTPPYTYVWSGIGAAGQTITNLGPGYYYVNVTDANGCSNSRYVSLAYPANCFGTITGTVIDDVNANCITNPAEPGLQRVLIDFTPGGSALTNTNGFYSYRDQPGTYTVTQYAPQFFNQVCPAGPPTYTVNLPGAGSLSAGNDFWDEPIGGINDLRVTFCCGNARPGTNQVIYLYYYNDGNTTQNASLDFVHDSQVTFHSSSPSPANYVGGTRTATWNLGVLHPRESGYIRIYLSIPANAVIGNILSHQAEITPSVNDTTPMNNVQSCNREITASFDPNYKLVSPEGLIANTDGPLFYTIHFQNTGNDTAFVVEVRDTLDSDLDFHTFKQGPASHSPYTVDLTEDRILTWTFQGINLPDSNANEPLSHGFVTFFMDLKPGLPNGTQIHNSGSIYFDFNDPVKTNTVINTITGPLGVNPDPVIEDESETPGTLIAMYPNPTNSNVTVELFLKTEDRVMVRMYNAQGQNVFDSGALIMPEGNNKYEPDLVSKNLSSGIYLVKVTVGRESFFRKLAIGK